MSQASNNRAAALAAQFKQKTKKVAYQSPSAPVALEIPGVFVEDEETGERKPLIFDCELRRVDVGMQLGGGQLPEHLARHILAQGGHQGSREDALKKVAQMSAEDMATLLNFQVRVAQFACVAPKLVFRPVESKEEIDLREVEYSGNIIQAIFEYTSRLSPDVPVPTTDGGVTTVKAVENFPDGARGPELSDAGHSGPEPIQVNGQADAASG